MDEVEDKLPLRLLSAAGEEGMVVGRQARKKGG